MQYPVFQLEDYLSEREFKAEISFCSSDVQTMPLSELLGMADPESKRLWDKLTLGYTEPPGHPLLRETVANQYTNLTKDNVLTFAGAEEGIYCAVHAILNPDDHAIAITPCYQSLETIASSICKLTCIPLAENQQWALDLEAIEKAIRPETKLILINFPHNPTGSLIDLETYFKLIDIARNHGIYIFSDEVYRLMELDEKDRLPAMADSYEKGLSLSAMTKPYGLAGLRIGWIASQDKALLKAMEHIKYYLSICNSAPSEILAVIALKAKDAILAKNRQLLHSNIQLLDQFFADYKDLFTWVRPKGSCTGFVRFLADQPADEMIARLLGEESVLLLPGSTYNWPGNYFRISFGRSNMPEALTRFKRFIEKNRHNWKLNSINAIAM